MAEPRTAHSSFPASAADDAADLLDLSVVIVNYNVRAFLEQALRSVERASAGLDVEVFVVDNNSVDGSVEMVRQCFPEVHVIANRDNLGFGTANNQAIRRARGRYLFILNPDTIVQEDTLTTLVRFMDEHPDAGAVGCQILDPDGTFAPESRRAFPTPQVAFYRIVGLSKLFPGSPRFGRYNMTYLPVDQVAEVDALSGSCMLVRHAALYTSWEEGRGKREAEGGSSPLARRSSPDGAGLFDEDFFMYGEDLDWCYRIQQAGWSIYYTPETQIIHYKGESTKKGDLRYVRLFYGAMLRFAEKHFHGRYSRLFIWMLRLGVIARAGVSVGANALRRMAGPLLEFAVVDLTVAGLGLLRSAQAGVAFPPLFYALVAPGAGLASVAGIALLGGYRRSRRTRTRPVWLGMGLGLLVVAALSFFIKDIAFSRAVVGLAFPLGAVLLTVLRLARRRRRTETRRAVVVGTVAEARRLHAMLSGHPAPPFELAGYVDAEEEEATAPQNGTPAPHRLGTLRHLRDLVRLERIDDVVFAASSLSNRVIFRLIDRLRDLPVQFRMLAEGREHVIGKASVDHLAAPVLVEAEEALGSRRSRVARRAFDSSIALAGLALYPLVTLIARAGSFPRLTALRERLRQFPAVLAGRLTLVGRRAGRLEPLPDDLDVPPAVFDVTEALAAASLDAREARRAYTFYVRNQSASLDWSILVRAVRHLA